MEQRHCDPWETDDEVEEDREPFLIADDGLAEWAMQRIAEYRAETAAMEAHYAAQLDIIRKRNEAKETFFTRALADYFATVPKRETKTQAKYTLPSGELVRRKQGPKYEIDDDVLGTFLAENELSEYVITKAVPKWAELKKACTVQEDGSLVETSTGLVIEGVRAEERPDKFEVKINA